MDVQEIRDDLTERFPQWGERIRMLRFEPSSAVAVAGNDGVAVYYNEEAMRRRKREDRIFCV